MIKAITRALCVAAGIVALGTAATYFAGWVFVASADASAPGTHVINQVTGRCLDSDGKGQVYTSPCSANDNYQQWYLNYAYGLVDYQTGRCLDSNGKGQVYTRPCAPNVNSQIWAVSYDVNHPQTSIIQDYWARCLDESDHQGVFSTTEAHCWTDPHSIWLGNIPRWVPAIYCPSDGEVCLWNGSTPIQSAIANEDIGCGAAVIPQSGLSLPIVKSYNGCTTRVLLHYDLRGAHIGTLCLGPSQHKTFPNDWEQDVSNMQITTNTKPCPKTVGTS